MDRAIYTAMGAARNTLEQQAVTANNMANASTPGFRAHYAALRAVPVNGDGIPTRTLVTASTPGIDSRQGPINNTSNPLDVAIQDEGFLAVQMPDGSEAYTRNGSMKVSENGQLMIQGYPVMGDGAPIAVPQQAQLTVGSDGVISALNPGDNPNTVTGVAVLKRVNSPMTQMVRGDDGFFRPANGQQLQNDPNVRLIPGALEGSNVNPVDTMVDMIANARRFEMQMKVISSADDNAQRANQLLSMS